MPLDGVGDVSDDVDRSIHVREDRDGDRGRPRQRAADALLALGSLSCPPGLVIANTINAELDPRVVMETLGHSQVTPTLTRTRACFRVCRLRLQNAWKRRSAVRTLNSLPPEATEPTNYLEKVVDLTFASWNLVSCDVRCISEVDA